MKHYLLNWRAMLCAVWPTSRLADLTGYSAQLLAWISAYSQRQPQALYVFSALYIGQSGLHLGWFDVGFAARLLYPVFKQVRDRTGVVQHI